MKHCRHANAVSWMVALVLAVVVMGASGAAHATDRTWNGASSNDWSTAANWTPSGVPAAGDKAIIATGQPNLATTTSVADLQLNGGALTGAGSLTVTGTMTWTGGMVAFGNGSLTIASGAVCNITGNSFKDFNNNAATANTFNNNGTVNLSGLMFRMSSKATFNNTGVFNISFGGNTYIPAYNGIFNNSGTFNTNSGGVLSMPTVFNNTGAVNVFSGSLTLGKGTDGSSSSGTYAVAAGATLRLDAVTLAAGSGISGAGNVQFGGGVTTVSGTYNVTGATSFDGGGTTIFTAAVTSLGGASSTLGVRGFTTARFDGPVGAMGGAISAEGNSTLRFLGAVPSPFTLGIDNATVEFATATTVTTLELSGTVGGAGDMTVTGAMNWSSGRVAFQNAALNIATGATLNLNGTGLKDINSFNAITQTINNAGTVNLNGTMFRQTGESVFNNHGVFNLKAGSDTYTPAYNGTFNNHGTLNANSGGPVVMPSAFNNTGTVNLYSGSLTLGAQGRAAISTGSYNAAAGTLLRIDDTALSAASSIAGAGNVQFGAGTSTVNGIYNITGSSTLLGGANVTFNSAVASLGATAGIFELMQFSVARFNAGIGAMASSVRVNNSSSLYFNGGVPGPLALTVVGSGRAEFNTDATLSAVELDGYLGGTGNVSMTGTMNWTSGALYFQNSTFNIAAGATMNLTGPVLKEINNGSGNTQTIDNAGTTNLSGAQFRISGSSTFNNSGIFNMEAGAGTYTPAFNGTFNNTGVFNHNSGDTIVWPGDFNTTGTLELTNGRLVLTAPVTAGGNLVVGANSLVVGQEPGETPPPGLFNNGNLSIVGIAEVTGNYSEAVGSDLVARIGGIGAGTDYDQLIVTGDVSLAATLHLTQTNGFVPQGAQKFTIVENNGGNPTAGNFKGLPEGNPLSVSGALRSITYAGGDGNDTVLAPPPCFQAPTGIVAWWPFEGNFSDNVGGYDGTLNGGSGFAAGKVGQGFTFSGANYIQVADAAALKPAQFTLEAWVNPSDINAQLASVISKGAMSGNADSYYLGLTNGKPILVTSHTSSANLLLTAPTAISTNTWHHLAATFDGFSRRLYVDGAQVANDTVAASVVYVDGTPLLIGEDLDSGIPADIKFHGLIDEPALYNRALSASEIQSIVTADLTGKCIQPPTITGFSPAASSIGSLVTITGTVFTGVDSVTFNGVPAATFFVDSSSQIRAKVPSNATDGPISVTNLGGQATSVDSFTIIPPNIVVTTGDNGNNFDATPGGLRAAMLYANANPGTTINFNIPASDPGFSNGVFTIQPISPLPEITAAGTVIDGTLALGGSIVVDGSKPGAGANGIVISAAGCAINAVAVQNFTNSGLALNGEVDVSNNAFSETTVTNLGTATWNEPTSITVDNGAVFNNQSGSLFSVDHNSDASFGWTGVGAAPLFSNSGTFAKNGTAATTFDGVPFTNSGAILAQSGTINFNGGFTQGAGEINLAGGTIASTTALAVTGGLIQGGGDIDADVDNGGELRPTFSESNPASPDRAGVDSRELIGGLITISGNVRQTASARMRFQFATDAQGNAINTRVRVNRTLTLNSSILNTEILNGVALPPGHEFEIIVASGIDGDFSNVVNGTFNAGNNVIFTTKKVAGTINNLAVTRYLLVAPDPRPTFSSMAPTAAGVGDSVVITGTKFTGATSVKFNGVNAPGFSVNGAGTQITVNVPAGATTGRIEIITGGTVDSGAQTFTVLPPGTLQFSAATYSTAENAGTATITVSRTGGSGGAVSVAYSTTDGTAKQPGDYTTKTGTLNWASGDATSKTFALALVNDAVNEAAETINLTLSNPTLATLGTQKTAMLTLTDDDPLPALTKLEPASGINGATITISGTNLGTATAVSFGAATATIASKSATQITTTVPASLALGDALVTVTTPAGVSNGLTFTLVANKPAIASLNPTSGPTGTAVTITGTNLANATALKFGATAAAINTNTATQITTNVPASLATGTVSVTVTTADGTSAGATFTVTPTTSSPPAISGFNPVSGEVGATVIITGGNFGGATAVKFNATAAVNSTVNSAGTQITAKVPAGATTGKISVTTPRGTATSAAIFTVTPPKAPTITSFTPTSGKAGVQITITGANFTGATAVKFKGVAAIFTVLSAAQIRATVPSGATTGTIAVTTLGGTVTSTATFTVPQPPTITTFAPISGIWNTEVTISGKNFTGATIVRFSNKSTTGITVVSDTQIKAKVPVGTITGPVVVTTAAGASPDTGKFVVLAPPNITTFSPASGKVGATITISGSNFTGLRELKFFNNKQPAIVSVTDTQIVAKVPVGATTGPIFIRTGLGSMSTKGSFFVLPGAPPAEGPARSSSITLSGATVGVASQSITLTFSGVLDADSATDATHYTVQVNGVGVEVAGAAYNRATRAVTLGLPEGALQAGDRVQVAWSGVLDATGATFSGSAELVARS